MRERAAELVRDELRRAWLRVEYQIRAGWARADGPNTLGPSDMGHLFAAARGERPASADADKVLAQWLAAHRDTEARIQASLLGDRHTPLIELLRRFQLTPRQWSTLMFALLPEVDPSLTSAYAYLARDPSCRGLDARLLAQLVYDTPASRALMARDLSASSPLVRCRLIDVSPSDSPMFRKIRAAARLAYLLDDSALALDPELAEFAELRGGKAAGAFPPIAVERATAALRAGEVVLAVQGQRGTGKKLLVQLAAAHWDRRVLVLDARRVPASAIRAVVRELHLLDAIPVFADLDDGIGVDDAPPAAFAALLAEWDGPLAITINRERMPRVHARPLVHLTVEVPPLAIRTRMWQAAVPTLAEVDAASLSGRFAIPGGVIAAASQAALASRMPDAGPLVARDLEQSVAAQLHQRISRLGKKLPTPFDLDDLVVDDDTRAALVEIASAAKQRRAIREQFALRGAAGISVLFSGHPGVGKTMSGTVLAKRLGLDIYEIDLSQVVSKWLGETEKNLSDVFDAAEPGHVVLLFNEADSLFGKRTTDVKSSNDRYANLETNYLLQRLERFNGLTILTTNMTSAIDQAFKRRFSYDVFFSFPSPDMRAELWRRTLPKRARRRHRLRRPRRHLRAVGRLRQGRVRARGLRRRRNERSARRGAAARDDRAHVPRARQAVGRRAAGVGMSASETLRQAMAGRELVAEDGGWVLDRSDITTRIEKASPTTKTTRTAPTSRCARGSAERNGDVRIHVQFSAGEAEAVAAVLCEAARAISPDTYEAIARRLIGELGGSMFDGWMKPSVSRDELTPAESARVTAIRDAMTSRGWTLADGWQDMFDGGIGLSPLLHGDKDNPLGVLHLEYFGRSDFLELSITSPQRPALLRAPAKPGLAIAGGQLRFRMFPGPHVAAVIAMLDDLSQPLDPTWEPRINALLRSPLQMDTPDGWQIP